MGDIERSELNSGEETKLSDWQLLMAAEVLLSPEFQREEGGPGLTNEQALETARIFFSSKHQRRIEKTELNGEDLRRAAEVLLSPEFQRGFRDMREKKGISLSQLALTSGISRTYLWQIEEGRANLLERKGVLLMILRNLLW